MSEFDALGAKVRRGSAAWRGLVGGVGEGRPSHHTISYNLYPIIFYDGLIYHIIYILFYSMMD